MKTIIILSILLFFIGCNTKQQPAEKTSTKSMAMQRDSIASHDYTYQVCHDTTITIYDTTVIIEPDTTQILFGALLAQLSTSQRETIIRAADLNMMRAEIYFSNTYYSRTVDTYLKDGFDVQINFNYKSTGGTVPFPADTVFVKKQAEAFFEHYLPYRDKIPIVVVENEWDNLQSIGGHYHSGTIEQYLTELRIITEIGHKYGFKITDAGITDNGLGKWTYSQLTTDSARNWWRSKYYVGLEKDYQNFVNTINKYVAGVQSIPIDFINTHWYNKDYCYNGYSTAINYYLKATGKTDLINNEFGVRLTKDSKVDAFLLFKQTVKEIKDAKAQIMVAYSGVNTPDKAILLTPAMLLELK